MSQRKKLVFLSLLVCFFLVLIFPRIANLQRSNKQVEEKETQELILSEGGYTVNQDINPGLYDFLVTEGEISLFGKTMSKGTKLVGTELLAKNWFEIEGHGSVKVTPAKFNKIVPNENIYTIVDSGMYKIGEQLPAGEYLIRYESKEDETEQLPTVQTTNNKGNIITFSDTVRDTEQELELVEGERLSINLHQSKPEMSKLILTKK